MVPFSLRETVRMADAVAPYGLLFYEEPMVYENTAGYVNLRHATRVSIAGGESLSGLTRFETLLAAGAVDIVQPDVTYPAGSPPPSDRGRRSRPPCADRVPPRRVVRAGDVGEPPPVTGDPRRDHPRTRPRDDRVRADLCDWPLELVEGHFAIAPRVLGLGIDLTDEHLQRYSSSRGPRSGTGGSSGAGGPIGSRVNSSATSTSPRNALAARSRAASARAPPARR